MKTIIKSSLLLITVVIAFTACNKTKKSSNRLIKTGLWKVTELSVNGTNEAELPTWEIEDCDIYKTSCMGGWKNDEGGHAEFVWQFREKGETFEISYQAEAEESGHAHGHEASHADEEVATQAAGFSGVYEVVEHQKDKMEFTSTIAPGHLGESVVIKIEKQ